MLYGFAVVGISSSGRKENDGDVGGWLSSVSGVEEDWRLVVEVKKGVSGGDSWRGKREDGKRRV